ncbi:MAG TPA: hypothetical protein VIW19_11570 [Gaiellaceae bacterium]
MPFAPSYAVLVVVQAALVLAPGRPRHLWSSRILGLAIPAAALVVGVVLAQVSGGADFLAALAAFATPVLAAAAGWARGWPLPWLAVLIVAPLYALAWLRPDHLDGDAAGVLLIAGACLAVTGVVGSIAPRSWLVAGLVLLVILDCVLVWGDRQVEPTMNALQAAAPPTIGRQLPSLQQIDFGDASMGWLDFAAPALLGLLATRKFLAALATGLAAGAWGLLFLVTSPIAATPPVLAGLVAGSRRWRRSERPAWRSRGSASARGRWAARTTTGAGAPRTTSSRSPRSNTRST